MLEKIFANKYAIWTDAALVTIGYLKTAHIAWVTPVIPNYISAISLACIVPFLAVILSLKGEVDGWS